MSVLKQARNKRLIIKELYLQTYKLIVRRWVDIFKTYNHNHYSADFVPKSRIKSSSSSLTISFSNC